MRNGWSDGICIPEHAESRSGGIICLRKSSFEKEGVKPETHMLSYRRLTKDAWNSRRSGSHGLYRLVKNYLDEAGLPFRRADWTWADYRDYANKMTHA